MKKIITALVSVVLILSVSVPGFAVKIDGNVSNAEWYDVKAVPIHDKKSGNNVTDSYVKYEFGKNGYDLYCLFCATYSVSAGEENSTSLAGMTISFDGCEPIVLTADSESQPISLTDNTSYRVTAYAFILENSEKSHQLIVEMLLNYKAGFSADSFRMNAAFIDETGEASNTADIKLTNPYHTTTTQKTTTEKTTKEKTTRETATKTTTTKATTVKESTSAATKNAKTVSTTRHKVTVRERTTRVKSTLPAAVTVTEKIKKAAARVKESARSYNEKTEKETKPVISAVSASVITETVTESIESEITADASAFGETNISRSTKYKTIVGAAAALLFGIIGVWAVRSRSDDNDEDET